MIRLPASRSQWNNGRFKQALKRELECLPAGALPLARGTSRGGIVDDSDISVTVLSTSAAGNLIEARIGVFFTEIIGGCSCGDDPLAENAYCEIRVTIDAATAAAEFEPIL